MNVGISAFRMSDPTPHLMILLEGDVPAPSAVVDLESGVRCEFDPAHEMATLPLAESAQELKVRFELGDAAREATLRWPAPSRQPRKRR